MAVAKSFAGAKVREAALTAFEAGLIVIPPTEDGVKRPLSEHFTHLELARLLDEETARVLLGEKADGSIWKHFLDDRLRPNRRKIENWYRGQRTGLGIATGKASGNLEALDFDDGDTFLAFCDTADASGLGDLVARIREGYQERTPSGGVHLLYRCDSISSNLKLATRPRPDKPHPDVLVETRGEGGYLVVAPSTGRVHPSGLAYRLISGGFDSIARISPGERKELLALARAYDECPRDIAPEAPPHGVATANGDRPGDRFNASADWREILEPHGWRLVYQRGQVGFWRRPEKDRGISATTNHAGSNLLYVFSTSTTFLSERGYSPFSAFAVLNHGGDFSAAARDLAQRQRGQSCAAGGERIEALAERQNASGGRSIHLLGQGGNGSDDHANRATPSRLYLPLTDLGNAERLVFRHGLDLRYSFPLDSWFEWDGQRFRRDETGAVVRRAKETVRAILAEAADEPDDERRKDIVKHARSSESASRLRSMVDLARSEKDVPVLPKEMDANPALLNVLNGTIDLTTGRLFPHRRDDLITKLAPVVYDPDATHPTWESYLDFATGKDAELRNFLQRAAGYTLWGDNREEVLFLLHGPSKAGKTTFLEAIKAALGDYAMTADFETWLARRDIGGPRPDIARLAGARLVASAEVEEGKRLAESLVKQIVGGDTQTARFLFGREFEFRPVFTLWLAANHVPRIRDDDDAIWNRVLRVPFEATLPKERRDPSVKATLRDPATAGPAVLAWMVKGCLAWQQQGLGVPPRVSEATEAIRKAMDPLREFVETCCVLDPGAWEAAEALHESYRNWGKETGEKHLVAGKKFGERLRGFGCTNDRREVTGTAGSKKRVRGWTGIRLATNDDVGEAEIGGDPIIRTESALRTEPDGSFEKVFSHPSHVETFPNLPSGSVRTPDSVRTEDGVDEVIK